MLKNAAGCGSTYEIRVRNQVEICWQEWFEGMTITDLGDGEVLLIGPVIDQSALHGLLNKIRDLNLKLVYAKMINRTGDQPQVCS